MARLDAAPIPRSATTVPTTWLRLAVIVIAGGLAGAVTAVLQPRGPVSTVDALGVMLISLATGTVVGLASRTTWSVLPTALAYMLAVEIGRLDAVGPTVDAARFDSSFGIIAFVVGRGVHGLLVLVPLVFGARLGATLGPIRAVGHRRHLGAIVSGALTVGLAVLVALPPSTPPVLGLDGRPIPGSIAEISTVTLDGDPHTITIRAADQDKPVLLYLSGGPGQSDLAYSRVFAEPWVHDFVVVDWDQRGNGASYAAIEPTAGLTLERAVTDAIELTEALRARFGESRIYVMGESWGTILGVLAAQRRPDLYHAFIGSGQMVNVLETDRRIYADAMAYARSSGDPGLVTTLEQMGEPPYRDFPWSNARMWMYYDYIYDPYTPSEGYIARGSAADIGPYGVLASEYPFMDKANVLRGLFDTFTVLYPQLYGVDLRREVERLDVPVYLLDGAAELAGRRALAIEWFDALEAPIKERITYEGAAHSVAFEQADEVRRLLTETIVPATYQRP